MIWRVLVPGGGCPPVFYVPRGHLLGRWSPPDRVRDHSVIRGYCALCPWGFPRVLLCGPLSAKGPFPTTFWLVCPHLSEACARAESSGGVLMLEARMARDWDAMREYHGFHRLLRMALLDPFEMSYLRRHPNIEGAVLGRGMGGTDFSGKFGAKCLHLHVASYLGLGYHPLGGHLSLQVGDMDCGAGRCGALFG